METATYNGKTIYTLTQIGESIQSIITRTYTHAYYVKAEMLSLNLMRSGHCYPELVEKEGEHIKAQMRAVIWRTQFQRINTRFRQMTGESLKDGLTILCLVTIGYTPQYGLALFIQDIEPAFTMGELALKRMETIQRLKAEGIFDANRRLQLPLLPQRIAVISLETSKGFNDFVVTLRDNAKGYYFDIHLFPSLLQGDRAISTMIEQLNLIEQQKEHFDCVAIIRGGGGDVGLSCYDSYDLAARVATFPLPVFTGIGHSTNDTIMELVAFSHNITPTEVAYHLISKFADFEQKIFDIQLFIKEKIGSILQNEKQEIAQIENRMQLHAHHFVALQSQQLLRLQSSLRLSTNELLKKNEHLFFNVMATLSNSLQLFLEKERQKIATREEQMRLLSVQLIENQKKDLSFVESKVALLHPDHILKRGFSITYYQGKPILDATQLPIGTELETRFYKGKIKSKTINL